MDFISSEMIAGVVGALVGGGMTTLTEWRMHRRQQKGEVRTSIAELMLDLVLIHADLVNLKSIISEAKENLDAQTTPELWQEISGFTWRPSADFSSANSRLSKILVLKNRKVVEGVGGLIANYNSLLAAIENYNTLRQTYENYMQPYSFFVEGRHYFKEPENDPKVQIFHQKMGVMLSYIVTASERHLDTVVACQNELYTATKLYFGSADFLKLPD